MLVADDTELALKPVSLDKRQFQDTLQSVLSQQFLPLISQHFEKLKTEIFELMNSQNSKNLKNVSDNTESNEEPPLKKQHIQTNNENSVQLKPSHQHSEELCANIIKTLQQQLEISNRQHNELINKIQSQEQNKERQFTKELETLNRTVADLRAQYETETQKCRQLEELNRQLEYISLEISFESFDCCYSSLQTHFKSFVSFLCVSLNLYIQRASKIS